MLAPIEPKTSIIVVTSFKCGILLKVNFPSNKREDAKIGKAEFFAPEAFKLPFSELPP